MLGGHGKEDGEGYEKRFNGRYGSTVCCARRVRAQSARSSASTDVSDASLRSARCGRFVGGGDSCLIEQAGTRLVFWEKDEDILLEDNIEGDALPAYSRASPSFQDNKTMIPEH